MKKSLWQSIKDFIFFPIRVLFEHNTIRKLGLTSLQDERFNICLAFAKGRILDIGCGPGNKFIIETGRGIGLDPYFSEGVDIMSKAEEMPFVDKEFQTITMMGTLRYIEDRNKAMQEIYRVLTDDGLVLVLENRPWLNTLRHALIWWNPYKGMEFVPGIKKKEIISLAEANQFELIKTVRYIYGLSVMYVLIKKNICLKK